MRSICTLICLFLFFSLNLNLQGQSRELLTEEQPAELNAKLQTYLPYHTDKPNQIGYLAIKDKKPINQATWIYFKMALEEYKKLKPIFILLELDTPGGELFATEQIAAALVDMDTFGIPVVAYINNWAISAGAMLAYSCRFIAISKDASMGAAEPIMINDAGQVEAVSEKVNSAVRADYANRAQFFDRNPLLAEGMVDKDIILVWRLGHIMKLDSDSQIISTGSSPDRIIKAKGKLLTLNAQQLIEYGVADFMLPPVKLEPISADEQAIGSWPASKSALFQNSYFKRIPEASFISYKEDWKTEFFAWLALPIVSSLLFFGLIIGGYIEFHTPGFGLAGTVAVICLLLILLSSFALQAASYLEWIMLVVGVVLILIEIFILPGFGLPGVVGALLTFVALFLMVLPSLSSFQFTFDSDKLNAAGQLFFHRIGWLSATLLAAAISIYLLAKYLLPNFSRFSRLVSAHEQESSKGYVAGYSLDELPPIGSKGITVSPLRPSGKVLIQGTIYDAMSAGGFINHHESISIIYYEGSRMVVAVTQEKDET